MSQASSSPQRERFLDAAEQSLAHFGLAKTTLEDVARAAGASRATLYRQFRSRDELLLAVVAREAGRLAAEAARRLERFDDVGSWIVEGMLFCLEQIPQRPVLAMLFVPAEAGVASRLLLRSERLHAIGTELLRPIFEPARARGLLRAEVELEMLMEWVLRALVSFLSVPSPLAANPGAMRRMLRLMILPAVLRSPEEESHDV